MNLRISRLQACFQSIYRKLLTSYRSFFFSCRIIAGPLITNALWKYWTLCDSCKRFFYRIKNADYRPLFSRGNFHFIETKDRTKSNVWRGFYQIQSILAWIEELLWWLSYRSLYVNIVILGLDEWFSFSNVVIIINIQIIAWIMQITTTTTWIDYWNSNFGMNFEILYFQHYIINSIKNI